MGLFEKVFRPSKNKDLKIALQDAKKVFKTFTAYQPVFTNWKGEIYESLMIRTSIDARARYISKLKVDFSGSAKGDLISKLRVEPNEFMTYSQFLYRLSTILDVCNSAFIVPVYDKDFRQTGIFPIVPKNCTIVEHKGIPYVRYKFNTGEVGACELKDCTILTKFQYEDDFFGADNNVLKETLDLITIQNQGIKEAVKNSASYRFMAQVNNFTLPEDLAAEREKFTAENFSREAKAGGILLFPNTYSNIQQLKNTPYLVDNEQMKMIKDNVYSYFGVNEDILFNKANNDSLNSFYKGAIEPFAIQLSEALTKALFTRNERIRGNLCSVSSSRLEFLSTQEKVNMAKELGDRGYIKINEARAMFGLEPLTDGTGEHSTIRGEYYFADIGKQGTIEMDTTKKGVEEEEEVQPQTTQNEEE